MSTLRRLAGWYAGLPLRTRLVAVVAGLLTVGLLATGVVTQAIVSRFLVQQVDEQLQRTASDNHALSQTITQAATGPSDYYVLWRTPLRERPMFWDQTVALHGRPVIPAMTVEEVDAREGHPFTVGAQGGDATQWRVVALSLQVLTVGGTTSEQSVVFVAPPPATGWRPRPGRPP